VTGRVILFGATGYTGRLTAEAMRSFDAAVRANGGRVEWTARHIMKTVPGYRGDTARSIGNALGQWSRAWKSDRTTFYGLCVTGVLFDQRVDDRACAVYVIETVGAAKVA
jgi:hypothetical protein